MRDREDLTRQREAVVSAYSELSDALAELSADAHTAAKLARRKRPAAPTDLLGYVRTAVARVDRAETAVDTARYDLHTASGGDG